MASVVPLPRPAGAEFHRMISGRPYLPDDPELAAARQRARSLEFRYNHTPPEQPELRREILVALLGSTGDQLTVEPMLHCDYGVNIRVGENFYANANCVLLDVAEISIGSDVLLAPGVQLLTATHPVDPVERSSGRELGFPITIGDGVWLGGGAIVCPGVSIGTGSVIGAGSVVTRDVPAGVVAVGNPATAVRKL